MTLRVARLSFWSWGAWWRSQPAFEEPEHWQVGYWRITVHLGRVTIIAEHRRIPPSLQRRVDGLVADTQQILQELKQMLKDSP